MLTLRRAPSVVAEAPPLDDVQQAALAHRGGVLRVLGGPGTGKTTTAIEAVVARVESGEATPDQCLILTSSRVGAGSLRERVTARLGGTSTEPLARTHQALGFGVLRQAAALRGDPTPRLLSGPEQDVILRELLAGHAEEGTGPDWPERVHLALGTRGFRGELRDLLMRAVEHDLEPADLIRLGREQGRPEWVAAAEVLAEYDEVTALSAPGAYDPAWILGAAADLLAEDPEAMARIRDSLRFVVVDDAQELTVAAGRLLETVLAPGVDVLLLGDPDSAVQTFRGADPRYLADGWTALGDGPTLVLPTAYRLPAAIHAAAARVAPKIGALGGAPQRDSVPGAERAGSVDVRLLRAVSQEATLVAAELREAHLRGGMPWSDMAVIVRGQGRTATLRRVLMAAGVPVAGSATDMPVREEVAVRPLLALLEVVLALAQGEIEDVPTEVAVDTLLSPIGGADAVGLRRLRRSLRREELSAGGGRTSDELLARALTEPGLLLNLGPEAGPARRVSGIICAGLEAAQLGDEPGRRWARGVSAESVLWAMWSSSKLAQEWRSIALGGGQGATRADRDLDAVVGLFDAAAKFADRLPLAGPAEFLTHIGNQDIPGDTLVARSPAGESVVMTTPQAAAGRQWRLVVVAGVQEGVWPDLRLRGSLLGSEHLVDVVSGRTDGMRARAGAATAAAGGAEVVGGARFRAAQAAVRYDETRLFLVALTRASERVVVTAVRSDDEQPSVYLDVVDPDTISTFEARPFTEVGRTMTLPTLVGALRRQLVDGAQADRSAAVASLAKLTAAGVSGADPEQWWVMRSVSDDRPLREPDQAVRISPSKVESFGKCGLRWLLGSVGGDGPSLGAADIGTLVHDIAADLGDVDAQTMAAEVDARWPRLGMRPGWVSDAKRGEAREMVRRLAEYFDQARAKGWEKVGAELSMQAALGRAVVSGRVDRLERLDGGLRVIDYKTSSAGGKPKPAELDRHPQLGVYQFAVEAGAFEEGQTSAGAALVQIGKGGGKSFQVQPQPPLAEAQDPQWAAQLVTETAEAMSRPQFLAQVGDHCKLCAVRASCPAQPEGRVL